MAPHIVIPAPVGMAYLGKPRRKPMLLLAALLFAQDVPCTVQDADLPPELAGWVHPGETLAPGVPVLLEGSDSGAARVTYEAETVFEVTQAGVYGVVLDQRGWIEVTAMEEGAEPLRSVAHAHGPACSSIAKIVNFPLEPGSYRLNLSNLPAPRAKAMLLAPSAS
ncbi:hypothetical protein [Stakelama tenebrarum]|uniref:Homogentisate 1,2-dioxygenase n=1 Tax=Stakelama tenebrarum TaxID=2711215 RepID=A0A6G6Y3X3_9SPHN|nr:hypothetical protein [Sphingosinithalassobacter tenebrarum]QIG79266.1 hypothetical protein G5C33_05300 [Sphingosinithalassobacter tenebrarum]